MIPCGLPSAKSLAGLRNTLPALSSCAPRRFFAIAFYQLAALRPLGQMTTRMPRSACFFSLALRKKVIHCGVAAIVGRRNPRSGVDHIVLRRTASYCGCRLGTDGWKTGLGRRTFQATPHPASCPDRRNLTAFRIRRLQFFRE